MTTQKHLLSQCPQLVPGGLALLCSSLHCCHTGFALQFLHAGLRHSNHSPWPQDLCTYCPHFLEYSSLLGLLSERAAIHPHLTRYIFYCFIIIIIALPPYRGDSCLFCVFSVSHSRCSTCICGQSSIVECGSWEEEAILTECGGSSSLTWQ